MSDDAFYLTPHDVRGQEFRQTFRGYNPREVEDFQLRVSEELERLLRERAQLEERLRNFQEQLRAFRDRERAMNEALLAAQQLRVDAAREADSESEEIIQRAKTEALRILAEAKQNERLVRERTEIGRRQFAAFLANFRGLLERHLGEVEGLEENIRSATEAQTEAVQRRA